MSVAFSAELQTHMGKRIEFEETLPVEHSCTAASISTLGLTPPLPFLQSSFALPLSLSHPTLPFSFSLSLFLIRAVRFAARCAALYLLSASRRGGGAMEALEKCKWNGRIAKRSRSFCRLGSQELGGECFSITPSGTFLKVLFSPKNRLNLGIPAARLSGHC